jgi:hypothetical protein
MLGTMAKRAAIKKVLIPLSSFWPIATLDRSLKFRRINRSYRKRYGAL